MDRPITIRSGLLFIFENLDLARDPTEQNA
jgi:hypothetical protein